MIKNEDRLKELISDSDPKETMKNNIVKGNQLITARYNLGMAELRIINLAIAKKGAFDNSHGYMCISAEDYAEAYGVHRNTAYEALEMATTTLFDKRFSYKQKGFLSPETTVITSRWLQSIARSSTEMKIYLKFSDDVLQMIDHLQDNFTKYKFKTITQFTSIYSTRLYEIFSSWVSVGKMPLVTVEEFRFSLDIESEYDRLESLKRCVLEPAIKEINLKSDLKVSYTQEKRGRRVVGFLFKVSRKRKNKALEAINDSVEMTATGADEYMKDFEKYNSVTKTNQPTAISEILASIKPRQKD